MKNLFFLLLLFCTSKSIGQNAENAFVYENNGDKIVLKIVSEYDFLLKNQINIISITTENIDVQSLTFSGIGLLHAEEKSTKENEVLLKINLMDKEFNKKYLFHFGYKKDGKYYPGKFEIAVKKKL
ncbi:hypothetical protein [Flavobacterium terrisoli]|uniref:hypothetical protein n=1 Tax=Flavobacterium terrisoli TaxID=3242195 RepID=UPI002543D15E|nr:hypothetical protein [Flavobacterium buctense]